MDHGDNNTHHDESDKALLEKFVAKLDPPDNVRDILEQFQSYRDYLRDVMLKDDHDTVTTNLIYRNKKATLAHIIPSDPKCAFQPKRKLPAIPDPILVQFGETNEILMNHLSVMGNWGASLRMTADAAVTVPLVFTKLIWEEDTERDPLGARRFNEEHDQIARYKLLRDQFEDDQFTDQTAEHAEMRGLERFIRNQTLKELQKSVPSAQSVDEQVKLQTEIVKAAEELDKDKRISDDDMPEVFTFQGFILETVDAEDMRWDWDVSLQKWWNCGWMAHRVWLFPNEIDARWDLSEEERAELTPSSADEDTNRNGTDTRQTKYDIMEDSVDSDGRRAVWEYANRDDGQIYVFVAGMSRFLDVYQPTAVHPKFFTTIPLEFNPTDGQPIGFSDVEMQMDLQDEYNELRTHEREARRASYPKLIIGKGVMTDEEKQKYEEALPFSVIEIERADKVRDSFEAQPPVNFNPATYSTGKQSARVDMEQIAGLPASALGGIGEADLATEVAFAGEQLQTQMDAKQFVLDNHIRELFIAAAHITWQTMPKENVEMIVGEGAFYPEENRESLFMQLNLEIDAGRNGNPGFQKTIQDLTMAVQFLMPLGVVFNPAELALIVFDAMSQRVDLTKLVTNLQPATEVPQPNIPEQAQNPGPAPGTPGGGFSETPSPSELPGG